jgi:hypothetical protein
MSVLILVSCYHYGRERSDPHTYANYYFLLDYFRDSHFEYQRFPLLYCRFKFIYIALQIAVGERPSLL